MIVAASLSVQASDTSQGVFSSGFATLQVCLDGYPLAPPVMTLGTSDRIVVSFDELADDRRYLRAELIHCNSLWEESGLVDSEFLDGINQVDVEDFDYSQSTLAHYVHYRVTIPDGRLVPKISGNYVLRIYDSENPDETLVRARFSVLERVMSVSGRVSVVTDIDTNDRHQQLDVTVDSEHEDVDDLFSDLTLVITQNNRADNETVVTHPMRVSGTKAIYEHLRPMIFKAANEYRRFETVSTHYPGMGIDGIVYADPLYHFNLIPDEPRATGRYLYDSTQQGRFVVRVTDSYDSDTEADYVVVHFSLLMPRLRSGEVYIEGDLTGRRLDESSRMSYNDEAGAYQKALLLKQGAYNYQYVVSPGNASEIEGDFAPTENQYAVKVFHRQRGSRYDRLVGFTTLFSNSR